MCFDFIFPPRMFRFSKLKPAGRSLHVRWTNQRKDGKIKTILPSLMVEEGGFEPPKRDATDLQSAPFGHSGTPPFMELVNGLEPLTC